MSTKEYDSGYEAGYAQGYQQAVEILGERPWYDSFYTIIAALIIGVMAGIYW